MTQALADGYGAEPGDEIVEGRLTRIEVWAADGTRGVEQLAWL